MSKIKQLIEDVAEEVSTAMEKGLNMDNAILDVLMKRGLIKSSKDVDTISLWKQNIYHMVA